MQLQNLLEDRLRGTAVAETPAGHRIGLRKAVDVYGTIAHTRELDDTVHLTLVGKLCINLIREDIEVVLLDDRHELLEVLLLHDGTGRVVRERQHEELRLRRDLLEKLLRGQTELVLLFELDRHRHTTRHNGTRGVGNVARLRDEDLIARIQHAAHREVDRLGATDGDHALAQRVVAYTEAAVDII